MESTIRLRKLRRKLFEYAFITHKSEHKKKRIISSMILADSIFRGSPVVSILNVEPKKVEPQENTTASKNNNNAKQRGGNVLRLVNSDFAI